jgi:hypothetical protein
MTTASNISTDLTMQLHDKIEYAETGVLSKVLSFGCPIMAKQYSIAAIFIVSLAPQIL